MMLYLKQFLQLGTGYRRMEFLETEKVRDIFWNGEEAS